jgi:hypothetical protein
MIKNMSNYFSFRAVSVAGLALALALVLLAAQMFAASAYAEVRDSGTRDRTGRVAESAPETPSATPVPQPTPPASGGITSSTDGSVSTGGNTGGTVTTGDESVEVYEVNIGPTNPPPPQNDETSDPAPAPEPPCDRRSPLGCPTQDAERVR